MIWHTVQQRTSGKTEKQRCNRPQAAIAKQRGETVARVMQSNNGPFVLTQVNTVWKSCVLVSLSECKFFPLEVCIPVLASLRWPK